MNRISLFEGIAVAIALACIGVAAGFILQMFFAWQTAAKAAILLAALLYLGYLLRNSGIRAGKLVLGAGGVIALTAAAFFFKTLAGVILAAVGLIWIVRAALYASGLLSAFAHLALCLLGAALAGYAVTAGGGVAAALWCFFLTQALWVMLPARAAKPSPEQHNGREPSRFNRAYATADAAIGQLVNGKGP